MREKIEISLTIFLRLGGGVAILNWDDRGRDLWNCWLGWLYIVPNLFFYLLVFLSLGYYKTNKFGLIAM